MHKKLTLGFSLDPNHPWRVLECDVNCWIRFIRKVFARSVEAREL